MAQILEQPLCNRSGTAASTAQRQTGGRTGRTASTRAKLLHPSTLMARPAMMYPQEMGQLSLPPHPRPRIWPHDESSETMAQSRSSMDTNRTLKRSEVPSCCLQPLSTLHARALPAGSVIVGETVAAPGSPTCRDHHRPAPMSEATDAGGGAGTLALQQVWPCMALCIPPPAPQDSQGPQVHNSHWLGRGQPGHRTCRCYPLAYKSCDQCSHVRDANHTMPLQSKRPVHWIKHWRDARKPWPGFCEQLVNRALYPGTQAFFTISAAKLLVYVVLLTLEMSAQHTFKC